MTAFRETEDLGLMSLTDQVAHELAGLPDAFTVCPIGASSLVIGPSGAFAVTVAERDGRHGQATADDAIRLAVEVRGRLCGAMDLVPFIDAVVVVEHDTEQSLVAATAVPVGLLTAYIVSGPDAWAAAITSTMAALVGEVAGATG